MILPADGAIKQEISLQLQLGAGERNTRNAPYREEVTRLPVSLLCAPQLLGAAKGTPPLSIWVGALSEMGGF